MLLKRDIEELEKVNGSARQALMMAADATKKGDTPKATEYNQAADAFANRLIAVEKEVESLKTLHLQSSQASDQAKSAVQQNSAILQKKLAERQKLLSQLDQAKMQEQMNRAMATLSEAVGQDVPTFDEVVPVNDLVDDVRRQRRGPQALPLPHLVGRMADEPLGEHPTGGIGDLHRVLGIERAADVDDPGRQQRRRPLGHRLAGAGVDG